MIRLTILLLFFHGLAFGQARVEYPYEYYVGSFLISDDINNGHALHIYSPNQNCIKIEVIKTGTDTTFLTLENSWIDLSHFNSSLLVHNSPDSVQLKGLFIKSLYPINITYISGRLNAIDATELFSCIEQSTVGNSFIITDNSKQNGSESIFLDVTAHEDSTIVDYILSNPTISGIGSNIQNRITLNSGESWLIYSYYGNSLTSSQFTSFDNKKIHVKVGSHSISILMASCDSLHFGAFNRFIFANRYSEPLLSTNLFSTTFVLSLIDSQPAQIFNIVSASDSNTIYLNQQAVAILNKAESFDTCLLSPHVLEADHPIGVMRLITGAHDANGLNWRKPTIVTERGLEQKMQRSAFFFTPWPDSNYAPVLNPHGFRLDQFYLNLHCHSIDTNSFRLNGSPFQPKFNTIPGTPELAWACVPMDSGFYVIENQGGFTGFIFSRTPVDQSPHAYQPGGYSIGAIATALQPLPYVGEQSLPRIIHQTDTVPFSNFQQSICAEEPIRFVPPLTKYGIWEWEIAGQLYQTTGDSSFPLPALPAGTYQLQLRDQAYCLGPYSLTINIIPKPRAEFSYTITASCTTWMVETDVTNANGSEVVWLLDNEIVGNGENIQFLLPMGAEFQPQSLMCMIDDGNCSDSSVQLLSFDEVQGLPDSLPNVITPNNDLFNDFFPPLGVFDAYVSCFELTITNRWGQQVLYSTNPTNGFPGQVGTTSSGNYFYTLRAGPKVYNGSLRVITP